MAGLGEYCEGDCAVGEGLTPAICVGVYFDAGAICPNGELHKYKKNKIKVS